MDVVLKKDRYTNSLVKSAVIQQWAVTEHVKQRRFMQVWHKSGKVARKYVASFGKDCIIALHHTFCAWVASDTNCK